MMPAVFGFVVGMVFGSFTQATAGRVISGKSLRGRSYCPNCKKSLRWYDLFPVFSFLLLRGKCRNCKKGIPREDLIVEILMGIAYSLLFWSLIPANFLYNFQLDLQTTFFLSDVIFKSLVVFVLALIFLIDLKSGLIPNRITYPAVAVTIIYLLASAAFKSWVFYQNFLLSPLSKYLMPPQSSYVYDHLVRIWMPLIWSAAAAAAVALSFVLLIIATRGKGMGWGDVKYVFFLGLALGFPNIVPGIFIAFLVGAIFSVGLILFGKKSFGQTVPFGPFLSLGAFIALLWGMQIINRYVGIF